MAVKLKKAVSALVTSANNCRWAGGQKAIETLRKRLDETEAALAASEENGELLPVVRMQALVGSRMGAGEIGQCVQQLLKDGHHEEARRLVAICERLDADETVVGAALLEALPQGMPAAIEKLDAIAQDGGKSARIRLVALAWLIATDAARSAHGPLLHIIGTSIDRRDWNAVLMGMDALQYLISSAVDQPDGEPAVGTNALLSAFEWPQPRRRDEEFDERFRPRWPAAVGGF